jgi:PhoH-like ATPase
MSEGTANGAGDGIKHFVLDTNVLLHNPDALFVFQDNHVIIPFPVIEELDKMKRRDDDIGRSARQVVRHLDRLRNIGSLTDGVKWGEAPIGAGPRRQNGCNGKTGCIRIDVGHHERPELLRDDQPDNRIIAVALDLMHDGSAPCS